MLPIIEVDDVDEAIEFINARYAQLAGLGRPFVVIENTQSGTVLINDTMIQAAGSSTLLMTLASHPILYSSPSRRFAVWRNWPKWM